MDLELHNATGKASGSVSVSDAIFGCDFNEALVHQVVTAYMAGARSGTRAQKNRAAVRGGGRKPWSQKGSGRARAGTSRGPIWRGGGRAFAAGPTSYKQKVNRKMYRAAIRSILSELARQERLYIVDEIAVKEPKTKELIGKLKAMGIDNALIVTEEFDTSLALAARNLYGVDVRDVTDVDPVGLVGFENIVITQGAIRQLEARLS